jgi:hypothetical protein
MDRSFLSNAKVIEASRAFVCVRLTTYEDEAEAKFAKQLVRTGSGELENTAFALLEPDGKTRLTRAGRSMRGIYSSADDMAKSMKDIARKFPGKVKAEDVPTTLPYTLTGKLGVNVAAADHLPLIVILGDMEKTRTKMAETVAKSAWGKTYIGHFIYAEATKTDDLPKLDKLKSMDSIVFIEPNRFGQGGAVLEQLKPDSSQDEIEKAMNTLLKKHVVTTLSERAFRDAAVRAGAFWEPKIPVSDPMEQRAREETKRRIEMLKK